MFILWNDEYNTGIDVIDLQHRRIVDYINELHNAINGNNTTIVGVVLDDLVEYTVSHFSFEESLMEEHGYLHTDSHRKTHSAFTNRIFRYQQEWAEGKDVSRKLLSELKVWLISHIQKDDQDYAHVISSKLNTSWVTKALGRFFK
jgi:hemerythrin